ncbi:hypothetical protein BH23GEM3_BH23GEM3_08380 [soil metagenome]|nr:hypothetical protein [Gemmatimonadota bacterium]
MTEPYVARPNARSWPELFGRAPIGVLVLGSILFLVGAGLIVGGAVFAIRQGLENWPVWGGLMLAGPVVVYAALHFIACTRWTWLAVVLMLAMIAGTAAVRAVRAEEVPIAPAAEILVSLGSLVYLNRPRVRQVFGR